jgi:hypothetical protein
MHVRVRICLAFALAPLLCAGPVVFAQEATPASPPVAAAPVAPAPQAKGKEKKDEYTGPTTVVELPPTPMLDEEGRQRLDPDGKPMFNPPVRQQRDKKGHPVFDDKGKPVMQTAKELGYDEHGKKIHEEKEKKVKATPLSISRGVMTVDGMAGKAALNYDIADLKYLYFYAPGIGIAVVSNAPFPGAKEQPNAFVDTTLTVTVDGHTLQLASDKKLLGKKPAPAYVVVDRDFRLPSKFPVMGYGPIRKPPYAWPGAKENGKFAGPVEPPPLPPSLVPVQLLRPCSAGQMRPAIKPALPGETAPVPQCVPITKATPVVSPAPAAPPKN